MEKIVKNLAVVSLVGVLFVGCGEQSSSNTSVPNNSYVELDDNQTLTLIPGSDVSAVDVGDGTYYITCAGGSCDIQIGDTTNISDTNNTDNTSTPTVVTQPDPTIVTQPDPTIVTQPDPTIVNPVVVTQ